ncbi:MAG: 3-isopropylmalate dehydratase small subunit [Candidatus Adiutrix sp.]|jgi:3-isopropylmalate/(R)-2-methylmalate dehydratase small subunit|nr:3-isopropylmalate dehydratase small subunit [Candidatus Adiutrix sp.]
MEKFTSLTALAAVLDRPTVETDLMVPKQFLTRIERAGFGQVLFNNIRYLEDGSPNPDFVLNQPRFQGARVLVSRENFGCGSSREHGPWALEDYGFKVIICPIFADIFKSNCAKIGLVLVELKAEDVDDLMRRVMATPGYQLTVNLETQTVRGDDGFEKTFDYDPFRKEMILNGWDDISLTLKLEADISAYEQTHRDLWNGGPLSAA